MRIVLAFIVFITFAVAGFSQNEEDPVVWSHEVNKLAENDYELIFKGKIADGWHIFSQFTDENGSLPSEFTFLKSGEDYELVGTAKESETTTEYSDIFEVNETFFLDEAVFTQRIRMLNTAVSQIDVELFYQVCKEVCIPKEHTFRISLSGGNVVIEEAILDDKDLALSSALKLNLKNKEKLKGNNSASLNKGSGLWMIFGLGFLGGLIALLTPCVFPMIPLTVSYFTKHSKKKSAGIFQASLYGFYIVLIYFLLSLPFHLFDSVDPQILNTIATNIWLNIAFFVVFVFFAFSFFGYYELTLPSSWSTKMDSASSKVGGGLGIFFMALTLAIVSFSCTGPILGGLLGSTTLAEGDVAYNLSAGMLGFGVALALPFALFAMFPTWLNTLPKSGGWMNTVKVFLGFLELALAFKFLSNADLVGNWGLFKREIFLGIWILLFVLLVLYLFGVIRFAHEGPKQKLSKTRIGFGILTAAFTIYLVLGVFNITSLKLLSGFPPPDFYSVVEKENNCPLGLNCFKDFEEGLAYAKKESKPILLDFTGWACVNCRKMEENVWSEPDIYEILNEDYVLISLYIDDRKLLPENERFDYKFDSGRVKNIESIGEKWGTFQTLNFGAASQPYYVLLSPDLEVLNSSIQNADSETYRNWLQLGLKNFDELNKGELTSALP
ncbi:cytochrome c biogenesis protein CcdA [uncultured Eudoraea sp.]|uniref:protein-disulfide reductase DsbD family protein n=1 Tax=uncultured Eudoraea sp. TaxID=1035614 RepID=UPI002609F1BC|nr:cytochrome c biogenesis protein CcdA [uncultured Eudoraea sp.]